MTTSSEVGGVQPAVGRSFSEGWLWGSVGRLDRWLLAKAPAERLATLRILVGSFVLVYLAVIFGEFRRVARLPVEQFEPVGVATLLPAPLSPAQVWMFCVAALLAGCAFVVGFKFCVSGPVFALVALAWASYHSSWGQMLHFEHVFTLHLLVLGFAPAADVWAVGLRKGTALRLPFTAAGSQASPDSHVRYGWPIRMLALITVVTYVVSAFTKLRLSGVAWLAAETLSNHIAYSATRLDLLGSTQPPLAALVVHNAWLMGPMAWLALLTEFLAPVALLGGRLRRYWMFAAILMHAGIALTMFVWFPFHGLGFAMLPLFRCEKLVLGLASRLRAGRALVGANRASVTRP